jgi:hypothetical protein
MRRVRTLLPAVVLLLGAPGVAGAAVTPGDYGGGALGERFRTGSGWMWARVAADGSARVGGAFKVACGLTRFDAEVTPAADGTFSFSRVRRVRDGGFRLRATVTVRGRFDGAVASGMVVGRLRNQHPDGKVVHCSTRGKRPWQLRMAATPGPPAPPQANGQYLGLTSQRGSEPRPFALRVNGAGSRVTTSIFEYTRQCKRRSFWLNEVTPRGRIAADGRFSIRDRFTLRYRDVPQVERFVARVDGQFAGGVVSGTLRVTSVARKRGTRRVVDRCDTGPLSFTASL